MLQVGALRRAAKASLDLVGDRHLSRLLQRQKCCRLPGMKDKTAQTQRPFCYKGPSHMLPGARTAPKFKASKTGREEIAAWMRGSRVSLVGMHLKWCCTLNGQMYLCVLAG